jgi:hypothetical protein
VAEAIEHDLQPPLGHEGGIELLERASREVARVRIPLRSEFVLLLVDPVELVKTEENLPADLHPIRDRRRFRGGGQAGRQAADGADIDRDIVPFLAIAPRDRPHEPAFLVGEADRGAVDLGFDRVVEGRSTDELDQTLVKLAQLRLVVGVFERRHRHVVTRPHEALCDDHHRPSAWVRLPPLPSAAAGNSRSRSASSRFRRSYSKSGISGVARR